MRKGIAISLENEIIKKIDNSKGKNEPRSRFIEDIIAEFLDKKEKSQSQSQPGERFPS